MKRRVVGESAGGEVCPMVGETFPLLEDNGVLRWREIRIGWRRGTRKNGVETLAL